MKKRIISFVLVACIACALFVPTAGALDYGTAQFDLQRIQSGEKMVVDKLSIDTTGLIQLVPDLRDAKPGDTVYRILHAHNATSAIGDEDIDPHAEHILACPNHPDAGVTGGVTSSSIIDRGGTSSYCCTIRFFYSWNCRSCGKFVGSTYLDVRYSSHSYGATGSDGMATCSYCQFRGRP